MTFASSFLVIVVGLAGAVGALSRYLLGRFIAERAGSRFPVGTLVINLSGAFVIGLLFALLSHKLISPIVQITLATGFLGGYTTFSTMSYECAQLSPGGRTRRRIRYPESSMRRGLLSASWGLATAGGLQRRIHFLTVD